jgi:methionyl aminopeptidase
MDKGVVLKTQAEIKTMVEGGKKLARVKNRLMREVQEGVSAYDIETLATRLILEEDCKPSFKMVPNYNWSTCVNINQGVVHGIPKKEIIFKKGDIVSIDIGVFYKGFHTDTSFSKGIDLDDKKSVFLQAGKKALKEAIDKVRLGYKIYDISQAIEMHITKAGYTPIRALVGHGVGRDLHEDPQIPCFADPRQLNASLPIVEGMVLAIEVMYSQGSSEVKIEEDGWTISSSDGTITALFEDTVAVTKKDPLVLT